MQRLSTSLAFIGFALLARPAAAHEEERGRSSSCEEVSFMVSLDGTSAPTWRVSGTLCRPTGNRERTLQILIHGSTYNRSYWDFPYMAEQYSYVRAANAAGFATLAIDRLGSGASDRPPGALVSVHATANTVHQIVSAIRSGAAGSGHGHRTDFDRIVLVGHSFGSNVSWTEAGTYGDVDGVILTAISHDMDPPGAILTQIHAYPAELDPLFASVSLPPGYLTTIPGKRGDLFYHLPGVRPSVIATDETTKDTLPIGVLFDQFTTYGLTQNIHIPVLNVVGDYDTLACQLPSCTGSGSIANEASFYPADACYTQVIVPNAGHSLNLHDNARSWYTLAQHWVGDHVGRDSDHRRSGCRKR